MMLRRPSTPSQIAASHELPPKTSAHGKLEVTKPVFRRVDSHTGDSNRQHGISEAFIYIMMELVGIIDGHVDTNDENLDTNDGNVVIKMTPDDRVDAYRSTSYLCTRGVFSRLQVLAPLISWVGLAPTNRIFRVRRSST